MNAEEARDRLLQAYDDGVTIPRTLLRAVTRGGSQSRRDKNETAIQPSFFFALAKR
jgi:hypothetical protein